MVGVFFHHFSIFHFFLFPIFFLFRSFYCICSYLSYTGYEAVARCMMSLCSLRAFLVPVYDTILAVNRSFVFFF